MRRTAVSILLSIGALSLTVFSGCGDGDGGISISIQVDVSPESAIVVTGQTVEISAVVIEGGSSDVQWYVNDILSGNATVGTVTQANPTTYTAPATLPDPPTFDVKAVSTQDTSKFDTCTITLTQDIVLEVTPG